jgi:hypothetical protein
MGMTTEIIQAVDLKTEIFHPKRNRL